MKLLFKKIKASNVKLSYTKCVYSGKKKTPSAKITINSGRLFKTKDYRIRYVNNKRVGIAKAAITGMDWLGLILICIVLPAVLAPLINMGCRKLGWVKDGDLTI